MIDRCQVKKLQTIDTEYAEAIIDFVLRGIDAKRPRYMVAWVYALLRLTIEYKRHNKDVTTACDPYLATFVSSQTGLIAVNISVHFLHWTAAAIVKGPIPANQHERHLRNIIRELLHRWDLSQRFERLGGRLSRSSLPLFGQQGLSEGGAGRTIGGVVVTA